MSAPLHRRPLPDLIAGLRDGRLTARGLLDHHLERIARIDPVLNAFVFVDAEGARAAARAADGRLKAGRPLSALDGVPVAIKDNMLVAGMPAVWGSRLFEAYAPDHDEVPVARLRATGAVLVGKTNTPEFSLRGYTDNPVFGVTRNPWNPALTPGGSSGGSVAAVAAGLVPLALGTDGGGSTRRPAGHTGLVGFKPGVGRIPRGGGFPELLFDCEVVGPIARTVADARLLFDALAAPASVSKPQHPLRVLAVERIGDAPLDPGIAERFRETAAQLSALGHAVSFGPLPFDVDAPMAVWRAMASAGLAMLARRHPGFDTLAAPDFADQARQGETRSAADYAEGVVRFFAFRADVARAFQAIDVILTPTTAAQPWPADEPYPPRIDGREAGPRGHAVYAGWVNCCGHPAISLPARPDDQGLPVGMQLVGAAGADDLLFDLAQAFETAHPWTDRWPSLAG